MPGTMGKGMPPRPRRPVPGVVDGWSVRATVKLAPSPPRSDGTASAWLLLLIIVMGLAPEPAMLTVSPFLTVEPLLNGIVPKLSRGSTPPRPALGASSTHSADECVDWYDCVVS